MKSRQLMFFTLLEDIEDILKEIESTVSLHYFQAGLFDDSHIIEYNSIFEAPDLGVAKSGDWNRNDRYLTIEKKISISVRSVPQRSGGTKYAVDQMVNPKSIEFEPGGIFKEGILVAGRVSTISEDEPSIDLYKLFVFKIRKRFKKIGGFYVGKLAEEKLKSGWRLVTNDGSPKEYDLALN